MKTKPENSAKKKHPMREAEARIERLRKALSELIGAETKEELEAMEAAMRMMPGIEADKIAGINAIHALLSEVNAIAQTPPDSGTKNL